MENHLPGGIGKERLSGLSQLVAACLDKEPQKALEYGREALKLLRSSPDPQREMVFLLQMSTASIWLGNYNASRDYARQSRTLALQIHNKSGEADALHNIAQACYLQGDYKKARDHHALSYNLYRQLGDQPGLAKSHRLAGAIAWKLGNFSRALKSIVLATRIYESLGEQKGIADSKNMSGIISSEAGDYQDGLTYFCQALAIYKSLDEKTGIAVTLNNIGRNYIKLGNLREASTFFNKSLHLSREIGFKSLASNTVINLGELYSQQKDYHRSLDHFTRALKIKKELSEPMWIAYTLIKIGKIRRILGQYPQALESLRQALEIARPRNIKNEIKNASQEMADILAAKGQFRSALNYYREYKKTDEILFDERSQKKIFELQTLYETDKQENEVARLKKERQLQQLELDQQKNLKMYLIIISLLVFLSAFLLYNGYRLKTRVSNDLSREIREHQQTAEKLQESEEKFRTLAENSAVGICIIQDFTIKYVNPAFLSIFGYSPEELLGRSPLTLVEKEDQPLVHRKLQNLMEGNPSYRTPGLDFSGYEFKGLNKTGKILYLESHSVYSFFQGQPAILETVIDITERKKAEIELLKMRKLEAVGMLAGTISRDFLHLLSTIGHNAQILQGKVDHIPHLHKMAQRLTDTSLKGTRLAQRLISFSGGGGTAPRKVSLSLILHNLILTYPQMQKFLQSLSIPSDLRPLYGDENGLSQVIGNLLWNALEAKTDSREVKVTLAAENTMLSPGNNESLKAGDYIKISMTDNGRGIPPDQLDRVFDPYFSTKETFHQKGMGLGLAICYSIIKKHNGHISIKSETGEGTTVEILVPAYPE